MKKRIILFLVVLISVAYITFLLGIRLYPPYSTVLRLSVTFCVFLIVLMTGRSVLNKRDSILMKIIFTLIFLADLFILWFKIYLPGVVVFTVAQLFLIYRNGWGIKDYFSTGSFLKHKRYVKVISVGMAGFLLVLVTGVFYSLLKNSMFLYAVSFHSIMLGGSVWVALLASKIGKFSSRSSLLITWGMITFFICDLSVGLGNALPYGAVARNIFLYMIWVFYTPALVFLSFSGYRDTPFRK